MRSESQLHVVSSPCIKKLVSDALHAADCLQNVKNAPIRSISEHQVGRTHSQMKTLSQKTAQKANCKHS